MSGVLALGLSYIFVFVILGLATLLDKLNILSDEGSRKFIHVGVSHWWLAAMWLFEPEQYYLAIIPPFTFIFLNYLSYRFDLVKSMERAKKSSGDLGTVYYAISLFIIAFFAFYFKQPLLGAIAILTMGYGDGFSGLIGKHYGQKKMYKDKSYIGFAVMFFMTLMIALIILPFAYQSVAMVFLVAFLIAVFASLIELLTPRGLDNLSVPLLTFFLLWGIWLIF